MAAVDVRTITQTEHSAMNAIERDPLLSAVCELAVLRERRQLISIVLGQTVPESLDGDIEFTADRVMELIRPSGKSVTR